MSDGSRETVVELRRRNLHYEVANRQTSDDISENSHENLNFNAQEIQEKLSDIKKISADVQKSNLSDGASSNETNKELEFPDDLLNRTCFRNNLRFLCENLTPMEVIVYLEANGTLTKRDAASMRVSYIDIEFYFDYSV